jgi:hypothetical protein
MRILRHLCHYHNHRNVSSPSPLSISSIKSTYSGVFVPYSDLCDNSSSALDAQVHPNCTLASKTQIQLSSHHQILFGERKLTVESHHVIIIPENQIIPESRARVHQRRIITPHLSSIGQKCSEGVTDRPLYCRGAGSQIVCGTSI